MSFILDALKQAEQERGSGRLPSVMANYQEIEPEEKTINWKKWLTVAIFINAALLFGWIIWRLFFFEPMVTTTHQNEHIENTITKAKDTNSLIAADDEASSELIESTLVAKEKELPPAQIVVSTKPEFQTESQEKTALSTAQINKLPEFPVPNDDSISSTPLNAEEVVEPVIPIIEEIEPSTNKLSVPKPSITQSAKVEPLPAELLVDPQEPEKIEIEPIAPEVQEAIAIATPPEVPEFAELPYSLQQEIPQIRISVHIYNATPSQRKARINGEIFRQGEQIDRDLSIAEITPHGVVFDYAGTLFRMSLR